MITKFHYAVLVTGSLYCACWHSVTLWLLEYNRTICSSPTMTSQNVCSEEDLFSINVVYNLLCQTNSPKLTSSGVFAAMC